MKCYPVGCFKIEWGFQKTLKFQNLIVQKISKVVILQKGSDMLESSFVASLKKIEILKSQSLKYISIYEYLI